MAVLNKVDCAIVIFISVMVIFQACSARLLLDGNFPQNLAFPQQKLHVPSGFQFLDVNHLRWLKKSMKKFEPDSQISEKIIRKYEPLVFNFLPRGTPVPPSGPSHGGNSNVD
ncbi:hypothetical protein OWV82_021209 [Melia azedarach]|uniref:Uncharacterized protein n=1 Tax=Melia azedarach TaxID=155640 RepID=A0ACC1WYI4_MELAZ|nr:hypothetical protein OWV82_021209 [Melia azedarach]